MACEEVELCLNVLIRSHWLYDYVPMLEIIQWIEENNVNIAGAVFKERSNLVSMKNIKINTWNTFADSKKIQPYCGYKGICFLSN